MAPSRTFLDNFNIIMLVIFQTNIDRKQFLYNSEAVAISGKVFLLVFVFYIFVVNNIFSSRLVEFFNGRIS